jgi:hypothetical protein
MKWWHSWYRTWTTDDDKWVVFKVYKGENKGWWVRAAVGGGSCSGPPIDHAGPYKTRKAAKAFVEGLYT